jgi:hypothetical protein
MFRPHTTPLPTCGTGTKRQISSTSFRLPRLIGRTRAEVYAMGGRPIQSLSLGALS